MYIGNHSGHDVDPSTTPIYEEILPSYSQALSDENKWNHIKGLELQENTAYQVTTFKLEENTAYAVAAHKECKVQENNTGYQSTTDGNLKDFELQENAAYTSTLKLQENAAYMSTLK